LEKAIMGKRLSLSLVLLFIAVSCSWGQERSSEFYEKCNAKLNSYRSFSEFDVFYTVGFGDYPADRGGITFSLGKQIKDEFSCGLLAGLEWYAQHDKERSFIDSNMLVPIGINMKRYFVSNPRLIPHISLDAGYSIPSQNGGFFVIPAVGLGIGNFKFQVGYSVQNFMDRTVTDSERGVLTAVQIKAGIFF
jgi:hypothetical protein